MSADTTAVQRIEIDLAAPPPRVYEVISTADGVRSWWTDGTFAEEVGGVARPWNDLAPFGEVVTDRFLHLFYVCTVEKQGTP
jgi:hypothetical protein